MSKIAISGNPSGTGTLTIAAPNTNSDFTLSLPATTAPILAGSGITLSASAPANTLVTTDAGNVGIGTSSPQATLDVRNLHSSFGARGVENSNVYITSGLDGSNYFETRLRTDFFGVFSIATGSVPLANAPSAGSLTERARIDSSGSLLVGTTSASVGGVSCAQVLDARTRNSGYGLGIIGNASHGQVMRFAYEATAVGSINITGSSTSYTTTSDYRLKHDIQPMTGALAKVALLKPVTYKWNADNSEDEGFIAHELQEVCPAAVTGAKDAVEVVDVKDEEGNVIGTEERPVYQGIDTSFLVATLTAAIQELNAKVDAQAAEIAALKGQA
jgi:hypothetical protein